MSATNVLDYEDRSIDGDIVTPLPNDQTLKFDVGKPMPTLTPVEWENWLTDVFMVGLKRHGRDKWRKVDYKRWEDALLRHWRKYRAGEMINYEDEGVFHLAQVAWNAMAILSARLQDSNS